MTVRLSYPIATLAAVVARLQATFAAHPTLDVLIDSAEDERWLLSISVEVTHTDGTPREYLIGFCAERTYIRTFHRVGIEPRWREAHWPAQMDSAIFLDELCADALRHLTKDYEP